MTIELANRLTELRKKHGLSQEELADRLGVSRQAVSKWERGEAYPDTDNLIELAKIYNISLDELVGHEAPKDAPFASRSGVHIMDDDGSSVHLDEGGIHITDEEGDTMHIHKGRVTVTDKNGDEADYPYSDRNRRINAFVSAFTLAAIVIAYILLGSILNLWAKAWVLFLLIPVVPGVYKSIQQKRIAIFPYPLLLVFAYLLTCVWILDNSMWHPLWVMFLTIPVFYALVAIPKRRN